MKVIDKTTSRTVKFHDIGVGDVFYYEKNNNIYMKTEPVFDSCGFTMANAVNLRIGSLCSFFPEYNVTPLNCECVITSK